LRNRLAALLPTFAYFARCFSHLHRRASRRMLEAGLGVILLSQVLRLMESLGWITPFPAPLAPPPGVAPSPAMEFIAAANRFYDHLWPTPIFWVWLLAAGSLCVFAGLHQAVAATLLTCHHADPGLLSESGEDDERFYSSVDPRWLLADVLLRRAGMGIGLAYFVTFSWILLIHTGWASLLYWALAGLFAFVDEKLGDTADVLRARWAARAQAEKAALLDVFGAAPPPPSASR